MTDDWLATRSKARWVMRCMPCCGAGHNIRLLLSLLRLFAAHLAGWLLTLLRRTLGDQPSLRASMAA